MEFMCTPFSLIGIVFIFIGIKLYRNITKFLETAESTIGEITNITSHMQRDGDIVHDVYVKFSVGGEIYSGKLDGYDSSMFVGKKINISYNPDDPNDFKGPSPKFGAYVFIILGVISLCVDIGFTFDIF